LCSDLFHYRYICSDVRDSASGSSRTLAPVAFFHDGATSAIDFHHNYMAAQRRARAIATAPRRKRHDDEDDTREEGRTCISSTFSLSKFLFFFVDLLVLFNFVKTAAVAIPNQPETECTHSLPQSNSNFIPVLHVTPPGRDDEQRFKYSSHHLLRLKRCPSAPLPSRNEQR
jgi:hypothetical protein